MCIGRATGRIAVDPDPLLPGGPPDAPHATRPARAPVDGEAREADHRLPRRRPRAPAPARAGPRQPAPRPRPQDGQARLMAALALAPLTREAASGCEDAWRDLVARFDPMLRGIVRGYRLDEADVADVVQTTWIRAYRNLDRLNDPGAIGGWLAVTTRREALRALQRGVREIPAEEPQPADETAETDTPETRTLDRERRGALRAAGGRPPPRPRP